MKFFVTGATGLLGRDVVKNLGSSGHDVTVLFHRESDIDSGFESAQIVWGDIANVDTFRDDMKGCDVLIHCAWDDNARAKKAHSINVDSISEILQSATYTGIEKSIIISSLDVYGFNEHQRDYIEEDEYSKRNESSSFANELIEYENQAMQTMKNVDADLVILRLGLLYNDEIAPLNPATFANISFFPGFGNNHLPYVHTACVSELIAEMIEAPLPESISIFNVAPAHSDTQRAIYRRWKRLHKSNRRVVYLPIPVYKFLYRIQSGVRSLIRSSPKDNVVIHIDERARNVGYSTVKAYETYGWIGY